VEHLGHALPRLGRTFDVHRRTQLLRQGHSCFLKSAVCRACRAVCRAVPSKTGTHECGGAEEEVRRSDLVPTTTMVTFGRVRRTSGTNWCRTASIDVLSFTAKQASTQLVCKYTPVRSHLCACAVVRVRVRCCSLTCAVEQTMWLRCGRRTQSGQACPSIAG
jgi:hypothetical protein